MISVTALAGPPTPEGESKHQLPLDAIFAPRTVAVIGASEKKGASAVPYSGTWSATRSAAPFIRSTRPAQRAGNQGL